MEKRKPYNLKGLLAVYNLVQVFACAFLIHGVSNRINYCLFNSLQKKNVILLFSINNLTIFFSFKILKTDNSFLQFWKCHSVDYRSEPKALTILTYTYLTFLLKLVELVETVFFVLRKKNNQVSKLHVYHHVSTATLGWIMVKYNGGKC